MLANAPIGFTAIGDEGGGFGLSDRVLPHWVTINGAIEGHLVLGSIEIEHSMDGTTRARCRVANPTLAIETGMVFAVVEEDREWFAGLIQNVTVDSDQSESVFRYTIEADGWDRILARHLVTVSYANISTGNAIRALPIAAGLVADGVQIGRVDEGVSLLLVEADHVLASDYLRDIGVAGGGTAYIDDQKFLQFRMVNVARSPIVVNNAVAEKISHVSDLDQYRNRQVVKVTGLDGSTTVTETRDDLIQQALRIADEGGSGIYENYLEIKHPTSSVSGELSILGQATGYLALRTFSRNARRVTVTMRSPAPELGQLVTVDLPGFHVSGEFQVMRTTQREGRSGRWIFDIEFWESSFQQLALESLLKIVGAAKAVVSISANIFPNAQLFSTPGSFTWTVPAGVTTIQLLCIGGSGSGGGGNSGGATCVRYRGGTGGASGKAITIMAVSPGQVFDIIVGGKGTPAGVTGSSILCGWPEAGITATDGMDGALSNVVRAAVIYCQGDSGGKGFKAGIGNDGASGTDGGGIGDAVSVGGGVAGGIGGIGGGNAAVVGQDGLVEVRW